jgi:Copper-binding of amyloid precursor, CuBD
MRHVATIGLVFGMGLLAAGCQVGMDIGDLIEGGYLGGTGSGNGHGSSGSGSGSAGKDSGPPAAPGCTNQTEGSNTSCKDVATWKQYASNTCESSGGLLSDYSTREECGKGLYRFVDYTCCPQPAPPPDPQPTDCTKQTEGGDTSCKDVATWKQYASNTCESSGGLLSDYSTREECGQGLYRFVDYTCCSQPAPPPDPQPTDCTKQTEGSDTSCKDVATWKQYAWSTCDGNGTVFSDYSTREECGAGLYRFVDFTCCSQPTPPPDPQPTNCTKQTEGSSTSCKDVGIWKQYAGNTCEANGGMLTEYSTREECGQGLYRFVDYTCCPK